MTIRLCDRCGKEIFPIYPYYMEGGKIDQFGHPVRINTKHHELCDECFELFATKRVDDVKHILDVETIEPVIEQELNMFFEYEALHKDDGKPGEEG